MNTIDELKYYCEEKKPVGAMMLTGEWGCGKTYMIDHELKETLKDTHIIIRISLFGISSIEEMKSEVKKAWISAWGAEKGVSQASSQKLNKAGDIAKKIFSTVADCLPDTVKNVGNSILSVNITDFIPIAPVIEDKKVILVFDDLERANMSKGDLLGCINDYCENQHFNAIVVANEKKISDVRVGEIPYQEIKEKIIQRTVQHTPDYAEIIKGVIDEMSCRDEGYKVLLQDNIEAITTIFSGITVDGKSLDNLSAVQERRYSSREEKEQDELKRRSIQKSRPHNIRSIKCALQDFERVYDRLNDKQIPFQEKWLCSYLTYVMAFRAGLIDESERYGTLFSEEKLPILYPGFYNSKYILKTVIRWIRAGEWNQEEIEEEIEYVIDRDKAMEPRDIVRTRRIIDIDEEIIKVGFPEVLRMACDGRLTIDEYVNFIQNSYWARTYNAPISQIDWTEVQTGLKLRIESLLQQGVEQAHTRMYISNDQKQYFTEEEWATYELIRQIHGKSKLMFNRNRKRYMELMMEDSGQAFSEAHNKRFDYFSIEMANATADAFLRENNGSKCMFSGYFDGMWDHYTTISDMEVEKTVEGFKALKARLKSIYDDYKKKEYNIAAKHTETFIDVVDKLIAMAEDEAENS